MKQKVKELKAPWTWNWVGQSSFQGTWGLRWAVVTPDLAWHKGFGIYSHSQRARWMLLLGKSLQVLPCRSGAGSVEQKIPAAHGARCPVRSPYRSEELFMPNVLPERVVLFSHVRLWGQTCSNFSYSRNESVWGRSLLNAVLLGGGLLEVSVPQVNMCAPMAAQAESSNAELKDSRRKVREADEQLIFPKRQLGLMEDPSTGCEGGLMHKLKKNPCIFPTVEADCANRYGEGDLTAGFF